MSEKEKIMELFGKGIDHGVIDSTDLKDLNQMRDTIGFQPKTEVPEQTFTAQDNAIGDDNDNPEENAEADTDSEL